MSRLRNRIRRLEQCQPSEIEPVGLNLTYVEPSPDGPRPVSTFITDTELKDKEISYNAKSDRKTIASA